ncbi:phage tail tape measure protein [Streptomyces griseoviridis]|uniref:phage tail tape measure protein n=1 Tax=Streptomyces griseoviridis TaxID=45398 RepID=UPI00344EAA3E
MSLTVGELTGFITIDDRAVNPALRRAEQAMRQTGQRLGADSERVGTRAGTNLGQGFVRGADGQWRNLRGELVDATTAAALEAERAAHRGGQRIGDGLIDGVNNALRGLPGDAGQAGRRAGNALGDGLGGSSGAGADSAVGGMTEKLGKLKMGAAAVGAAAGAVLMQAFGSALEQGRITGRLGAQLGKTPAEAQRYGKIAGALYADAVTEDFQGAADAISATMRAGIAPPGATNAQIQSIATKVSDLAGTFELDLGQAANAVGQILKTGLAKNGGDALDVLTRGLQVMGPRADDIADTFNEYSVIFKRLGLDAKTATGLMSQGLKAGARDTDVVADALKEFTIEGVQGSSKIVQGFKDIGLNSSRMVKMIAKGGPDATKALQMTLDKLREMKDPVERDAAATALFGTKAEDVQGALQALDPSKAVDALGKVGGAADDMGDSLRDNAGTKLTAFKRGLEQGLTEAAGGALLQLDDLKTLAGTKLRGLWDEAGKNVDSDKLVDQVVAFFPLLGQRLLDKANELGPKVVEGLQGAGQRIAEWVMANPTAIMKGGLIAAAIVAAFVALPLLVGGALTAAATTVVVGFVTTMINALGENAPKWWDSFTGWLDQKAGEAGSALDGLGGAIGGWFGGLWSTYISGPVGRTWDSFITSTQGLPGRATGALSDLGGQLSGSASRGWRAFKDASVREGSRFIGWVRGMPGRISSGVGSLGSLLVPKGRNVVEGLWSGVQSMGGWIKSKLIGWAKEVIPGPIAKALGIRSPSRVTKAQGRWIAKGLIAGLTGSSKEVKAASGKLADIIADGLKPGRARSEALKTLSAGTKQLLKLASQEEKVAARLKKATSALADLKKERDQLATSVRDGILGSANITQQTGSSSPAAILARLQRDRKAAEAFTKSLAKLKSQGVRSDLIEQIASAGVDQGAALAASLASATPAQIKAINAEQAKLAKAAGTAGNTAADAMYGAGIRAGEGLVKGLQKQQAAIEKQMLKIAKSMSKSIRKALGIKSPSRVMARIGAFTAQGLVRGIEGERRTVDRTMAGLVSAPTPTDWAVSRAANTPQGGRQQVVDRSTTTTYNLTQRDMTIRDLEVLQRRQDARARVGRPR